MRKRVLLIIAYHTLHYEHVIQSSFITALRLNGEANNERRYTQGAPIVITFWRFISDLFWTHCSGKHVIKDKDGKLWNMFSVVICSALRSLSRSYGRIWYNLIISRKVIWDFVEERDLNGFGTQHRTLFDLALQLTIYQNHPTISKNC